jgi:hypothetical protein
MSQGRLPWASGPVNPIEWVLRFFCRRLINLGHNELTQKVGLTTNKTTAAIRVLGIKDDSDSYKEVAIGKVKYQRYSQNAIRRIKDLLKDKTTDEIWAEYRALQASAKKK